jgi:FKBP-type peptidyl-prolyl cis-trans isomerase 2
MGVIYMAEKNTTPDKESHSNKESPDEIKSGSNVKFHYTGKLDSGTVFDSSEGKEPLQFKVGEGMIIPGLEKQLVGMKVGEKKEISVPPDEAYGERRDDLTREIPKGPVPEGMALEKGAIIYLKTPDGQAIPATILEVKDQTVVMDFNHPLAGQTLVFNVEILEVA